MSPIRRVGVLGDIHAEDKALEAALEALKEARVEAILAVGDIVDGPGGNAERCCKLLQQAGVLAVRGNHERWLLAGERRNEAHATPVRDRNALEFLGSLPRTRELDTPSGRAMLCHGVGEDDMSFLKPDTRGYGLQDIPTLRQLMLREDLVFMIGGHTHQRMVRRFPGLTVVNVGTLHREDDPCFATIDFERRSVDFYDFDAEGRPHRGDARELVLPDPV